MIIFESIELKNFLSVGNSPLTIDYTKSQSTLIVGGNGVGKSSLFLDSITYALYGKAYRKVNKSQLINSINKKQCLVELCFKIGVDSYKIRRGMKPTVFEIYVNGKMLDQDSKALDYQNHLEEQILKMSYKSFVQIVILGSANYVPFMNLSASDRRKVVEDLLDIGVFSHMSDLLKERNKSNEQNLAEISRTVSINQEKINGQEKVIKNILDMNAKNSQDTTAQIAQLDTEIAKLQTGVQEITASIESLPPITPLQESLKGLQTLKQDLSNEGRDVQRAIKGFEKDKEFYTKNDTCSTCTQPITGEFKTDKIQECDENIATTTKGYTEKLHAHKDLDQNLQKLTEAIETLNTKNRDIANLNIAINSKLELKNSLTNNSTAKQMDTTKEVELLKTITEANAELVKRKEQLLVMKEYYSIAGSVLRDSGVVSRIIKEYIPIINTNVNKYLQAMDFFVSFKFDENFDEVIASRHRDEFSYESFSMGERQRIDLSLMFAWRNIAKLRNSVYTNLLIMDETFDSSLDVEGTEDLTKILNMFKDDTNVFVISHSNNINLASFNRTLEVKKDSNFTSIKENNDK